MRRKESEIFRTLASVAATPTFQRAHSKRNWGRFQLGNCFWHLKYDTSKESCNFQSVSLLFLLPPFPKPGHKLSFFTVLLFQCLYANKYARCYVVRNFLHPIFFCKYAFLEKIIHGFDIMLSITQ